MPSMATRQACRSSVFTARQARGSCSIWRIPLRSNLGIRLIAPERPGFGISTYQRGRTLASYAIDIADFADALGIEQFAVAGISGGGPYAAACAAFLPDRVSALGLVSPIGPMAGAEKPPSIGKGHYFAFRVTPRLPPLLAAVFAFGRYAFLYAPNAIYGFIMGRASPSDWKILSRGEVRRNLLQGVAEGCRPGIGAGMQEMGIFSRPWNVPFQEIAAPAFLWQGMADRNVSVAASLCLAELVPNCRTQRIDNAGHYWIFDNIAEVLQTLAGAARESTARAAGVLLRAAHRIDIDASLAAGEGLRMAARRSSVSPMGKPRMRPISASRSRFSIGLGM